MLNVNFNLRKQDSKKEEVIYLVLRWNGNYYRYPTSFKVLPKNWDIKKQRIRAVINEPLKDQINAHLGKLESASKKIYADAIAANIVPSKAILKEGLDRWTGRKVDEKPVFWRFIDSYVESSNKRLDPKTGRTISKRTIQEYVTTTKALREFESENRQQIEFENLSLATLNDFRDFLTTVKKYSVNNVAKHIDNFRQFLRAAQAGKIDFDTDLIDNKKFSNAREVAHNVYLSENELAIIAGLDLTASDRLEKARDLFLIGCFTGLRISDYNNIKPHNIKGGFIDLYQTKTGGRVVIPILPPLKSILAKYEGGKLPKLSDQKLNQYVKEVCKLAGINEETEKQRTTAGERVIKVMEKWKMVSSHTARRSFATNMIKRGYAIQTIMSITGHTKESTFLKYVKLTAAEHAEIMRSNWKEKAA